MRLAPEVVGFGATSSWAGDANTLCLLCVNNRLFIVLLLNAIFMETKDINNLLSFVTMVCREGYLNGSYEATINFMNRSFPNLPAEVRKHIETLLLNL